jgi:hypothetical protein
MISRISFSLGSVQKTRFLMIANTARTRNLTIRSSSPQKRSTGEKVIHAAQRDRRRPQLLQPFQISRLPSSQIWG